MKSVTEKSKCRNNYQLLGEVEQNIVICEPPTNHDILREPSPIIALSFSHKASYKILKLDSKLDSSASESSAKRAAVVFKF